MTYDERRQLRLFIDRVRREQIRRASPHVPLYDDSGATVCPYCGETFTAIGPQAYKRRFCTPQHRQNYNTRKQRARRREAREAVAA